MNLWKKFKAGLFTKSQVFTGITISLITTSAIVFAFNQLSLNIFTSGTTISATEVNANFEYLDERIKYIAGEIIEVQNSAPYVLSSGVNSATVFVDQKIVDFTPAGTLGDVTAAAGYFTAPQNGNYKITIRASASNFSGTAGGFYMYAYRQYLLSGVTNNQQIASFYMNSSQLNGSGDATPYLTAGDIIYITPGYENHSGTELYDVKLKIERL